MQIDVYIKMNKKFGYKLKHSNKRRSRAAIFSVNGAQSRLIDYTPNQFQKETKCLHDNTEGDFFENNWSWSFIEFWVRKSTKYENQVDHFAFSSHQDSDQMNKIGDFEKMKLI